MIKIRNFLHENLEKPSNISKYYTYCIKCFNFVRQIPVFLKCSSALIPTLHTIIYLNTLTDTNLRFNFCTVFSPYSALASALFSLSINTLI